MAARLIRDAMLDSERVHALTPAGRWVFVAILLMADDLGLLELNTFQICRKAGVEPKELTEILAAQVEQDLIRTYQVGKKTFAFIPEFRQRLQIKRSRCPLPPIEIVGDDEDVLNKINHLASNPRLSTVVHGKTPSEPEPEPEEEKEKRHTSSGKQMTPPCPHAEIIWLYHDKLPTLPRVRLKSKAREAATTSFWRFVLTSTRDDGVRRAETPADALAWIGQYFERAGTNDFLMGRNKRADGPHANWRCDFDFLMTEKGKKHVIEKTNIE